MNQPKPFADPFPSLQPIGIIAGSGILPVAMVQSCINSGRAAYVVGIEGKAHPDAVAQVPHLWCNMGAVGKAVKYFKQNNVQHLVLAGRVGRPDIKSLHLDYSGARLLFNIMRTRSKGDNAIFTAVLSFLEESGFIIGGIDREFPELMAEKGVMGSVQPDRQAHEDIALGIKVVHALGELDIGQAAVVQQRTVLGVEGLEGTDRLIERCGLLKLEGPGGVLIKMKKPGQDTRIDLPTIGVQTVINAHQAGLRGIAVEAGNTIVLDKSGIIAQAEALGVFVIGI